MKVDIVDLINNPEKLSQKSVLHDLNLLITEYPYYQTARLLYLKGLYATHDIAFGEELRRMSLYVSDRSILFNLIEGEFYQLNPVVCKPTYTQLEQKESDRTQELIEAFLSGLPIEKEEKEEHEESVPELNLGYTSYVFSEDTLYSDENADSETDDAQIPSMKGQQLIDDFIKQYPEEKRPRKTDSIERQGFGDELPSVDEDDGYFTETLAKIYIKQHRYTKALEIIRRLSLKYPKKNAYFADQIRSLEYLIAQSDRDNREE